MGTNSKEASAKLKAAMLTELEKNGGKVKLAAEAVKITEQTHYRWCREDNNYNNTVGSLKDIRLRNAKEKVLDIALLKIETGSNSVLNKLLSIFYKDFTDYEEQHYNSFNDNPNVEEEEEDED